MTKDEADKEALEIISWNGGEDFDIDRLQESITTALLKVQGETARECAEIAHNHYSGDHCCEDCPCHHWREEVATAIKERFGV